MQTFKRPLIGKRKDSPAPNCIFDYRAIREAAAPNPFGLCPDKLEQKCTADANCHALWNGTLWSSGCTGVCLMG